MSAQSRGKLLSCKASTIALQLLLWSTVSRRCRQIARLTVAAMAIWLTSYSTSVASVEYATPISKRLNTTGRPIDMDVPMKDHDRELGDIPIRINPNDSILINRAALIRMLATSLNHSARERLAAIGGGGPFIPLNDFENSGFHIRFDRALQELIFSLAADQRKPTDISLSGNRRAPVSSVLAPPAKFSGYVNLFASVDHEWAMHSADENFDSATSGRLDFDSAVRAGDFVFENTGVLAGDVDVNVCPTVAVCSYTHSPGLKRQTSRLVYDMPASRVRMEVGDVEPLGTSFQNTPDLLGVSIEKSARKLSPGDTFAPTGGGSFVIRRPSEVEIRINGVVQRRLQLRPGTYNIRDLPLVTGANDVDIVITDDTGKQQHVSFTSFFDTTLLAAGKSEWGITAGQPSYLWDEAREYVPGLYVGSVFYRYGLRDDLVGELDFQGDNHIAMAGTGIITDTPWGLFGVRGAASAGEWGAGFAAGLDWSAINIRGFTHAGGESFRLAAEYRSPDFHTAGEINTATTGIIFPEWNYWLNLNATYSAPIGQGTTASLSGRYEFVNNEELGNTFFASGNRYGIDVTFSRPLTESLSGSLTLGVSNESYLSSLYPREPQGAEFRVGIRLFGRPDENTNISAGFDTLNGQSDVSAYRTAGNGIGRWDTSVDAQQNDFDDRASVNGTIGYYGNRGQVRLIHNSGFDGVSLSDFKLQPGQQRTSLQVGTSIAFADGHIAIGAPITGDAFAIVYPHESIADKTITVGSGDNVRAVADGWGPAVVTNLPAYTPSTIPVDADDLPVGYSLGAAAFDTFAPLKAGYALEVGSDYSVSAYGTLLLSNNEPVSLISGSARSVEHSDKTVTIFTNGAGRFGADGLAPGRWIIEMATDGAPTRFALNIPPNVKGLFKAGTLHPIEAP
jgi:outer membrane usher protein